MLLPDNQALPENLVEIQFPSERKYPMLMIKLLICNNDVSSGPISMT